MTVFVLFQSKERLIASLREGSGASGESVGVSSLEYDSVKQERDMFKEELQQSKMTSENLRVELLVCSLIELDIYHIISVTVNVEIFA